MKKFLYRFNWTMFIVLLVSICSLDNPSWTPTIIAVISGALLTIGAYILEQINLKEDAENGN